MIRSLLPHHPARVSTSGGSTRHLVVQDKEEPPTWLSCIQFVNKTRLPVHTAFLRDADELHRNGSNDPVFTDSLLVRFVRYQTNHSWPKRCRKRGARASRVLPSPSRRGLPADALQFTKWLPAFGAVENCSARRLTGHAGRARSPIQLHGSRLATLANHPKSQL